MSLKDEWDSLDSGTRTWLLENPACLVLPAAISAKFSKVPLGDMARDPRGQVVLSPDDHDFIRDKAEAAGIIRIPAGEYRFFDTAPLPVIRNTPPGTRATAPQDEVR